MWVLNILYDQRQWKNNPPPFSHASPSYEMRAPFYCPNTGNQRNGNRGRIPGSHAPSRSPFSLARPCTPYPSLLDTDDLRVHQEALSRIPSHKAAGLDGVLVLVLRHFIGKIKCCCLSNGIVSSTVRYCTTVYPSVCSSSIILIYSLHRSNPFQVQILFARCARSKPEILTNYERPPFVDL